MDALVRLPPAQRERLVAALETGLLAVPVTPTALHTAVGSCEEPSDVIAALDALSALGVSGPAAGAWLRTATRVAQGPPRPDMVWSGPPVAGLHARSTRRVYEELLGSAVRSVLASTYVFFDGPIAFKVLAQRMDEIPGLRATLLLNIQRRRGDTTAPDALVRQFAERFWDHEWPGTRRPNVYYFPGSLDADGATGVLHAKAVVTDDETVFITSANLTEAALDRNIELGLLVRDPALAASVALHFGGLIDRGLLLPLPGARDRAGPREPSDPSHRAGRPR